MPLAPHTHDAHQDRLVERADQSADAAESAVLRVWLRLLDVIRRGGPWPLVYRDTTAALRTLPDAASIVTRDLAALARDSARWTAEHIVRRLPRSHRQHLYRRQCVRPHSPHLFEAREPDPEPRTFPAPIEEEGLVVGAVLPALPDVEVLRVIRAAGWLDRLKALTRLVDPEVLAATVATAVQQGLSVQEIVRRVRPAVQNVQTVARRAARTAGLWVAHEAELATYDNLGDMIEGYEVRAVLDHATRPEHRRRDGTRYYRVPKAGQKGFDQMPRPPREADGSWAWNCLLPDTIVQGVFDLALKARYAGKVIEISTRSSRTLRVTPNHPVCTPAGFLPAGQIREGDSLIGYGSEVGRRLVGGCDDEENPPARIDEVFRAAEQLRPARAERGSVLDLHGDAAFGDRQIEVVRLGRELRDDDEAAGRHRGEQLGLVPADVGKLSLPRRRSFGLHLDGIHLSAPGLVGGLDLGGPAVGVHPRPLQPLRLGPAANLDARRKEYPSQPTRTLARSASLPPADAEFVRELLERLPGVVSPDHVVEVRQFNWSGHVYDLQSPGGWIVANELLVSNCRCYLAPILASE